MAKLTMVQIVPYARGAGFTGNDLIKSVAIAYAESAGVTNATHRNNNGTTDYGLWQINSIHKGLLASGSWSDPASNARMAYTIYSDAGKKWRPWATYNSGRYLAFMSMAGYAVRSTTGEKQPDETGPNLPNAPDLSSITDFAKFASDPHNWLRFGMFWAGFILLVIAAFRMTGDNKLGPVSKVAAAVITKKVV